LSETENGGTGAEPTTLQAIFTDFSKKYAFLNFCLNRAFK